MALDLSFPRRPYIDMYLGGDWRPVVGDIRQGSGIKINRGRADEQAKPTAAKCTFVLDDGPDHGNGDYSPRNASGQWYDSLRRNVPVRVGLEVGKDAFTRTVASGWGTSPQNGAWTTGAAGTSVSSNEGRHTLTTAGTYTFNYLDFDVRDIDVAVSVTINSVSNVTGGDLEPANIMLRGQSTSSFYLVRMVVTSAEVVQLRIMLNDSTTLAGPVTLDTAYSGQQWRVRANIEQGHIMAKAWPTASPEPLDWQIGTIESEPLGAGFVGIRSGRAGGNTNTSPVFRYDDFELRKPRFIGEASRFTPSANLPHTVRQVSVECGDVLRRLQRYVNDLPSALRTATETFGQRAYWPLEEGVLGLVGQPAIGNAPMILNSTRDPSKHWGNGDLMPWTTNVVGLYGPDDYVEAKFRMDVPNSFWALEWYFTGDQNSFMRITITTNAGDWVLILDPTGVDGFGNGPGKFTVNSPYGTSTDIYLDNLCNGTPRQVMFVVDREPNFIGGSADELGFNLSSAAVGGTGGFVFDTPVETAILGVKFEGTGDGNNPAGIGHISLFDYYPYDLAHADQFDLRQAAAAGHAGETALERFVRICGERGERFSYVGDETLSGAMGAQYADPLLTIIGECVDVDNGSLYSLRSYSALALRGSHTLAGQTATVTLDYSNGEVAEPFAPPDDDQGTLNDYTAKRRNGGEYRYEKTEGPLNVNDPGTADGAIGRVDGGDTLNPQTDAQLADQAGHRVSLGTVDEARFPNITVNLTASALQANPALATQVLDVNIDDLLVIQNATAQLIHEDVRQIARGSSETILGAHQHVIEFNTTPASPYDVPVLDDTDAVIDSSSTTLNEALDTTETGVDIANSDDVDWTHADGDFDIVIGGERMTVTAVTGAGATQTFTVTRSVNGVVKSHSAGATVKLADPDYVGLFG